MNPVLHRTPMRRPPQCSLAQLLAGLFAAQVVCAAAAGAFGELVQVVTLVWLAMSLAAVLHLVGEGLAELAAAGLAAALERLPLETRPPPLAMRRW